MVKRKSADYETSPNPKVSQHTRSKRPRLVPGLKNNLKQFPWTKATGLYNYMTNDPLIDWLESDHDPHRERPRSESFSDAKDETFEAFLRDQGIKFEQKVIDYISNNIHDVTTVAEFYSAEGVEKTKELLKKGVPILHSAPLSNVRTKTYGVADLIVRSDYLRRIVPNGYSPEIIASLSEGSNISKDYHYVVIDIKFSTLPLNAQGIYLVNQGSYSAYKAQIWVYSQALGLIQGYTPDYGFILGRRWSYTSKGVKSRSYSCLDRLGTIEFKGYDKKIIKKARKALRWSRDVKTDGYKWTTNPPSRPELYPNMCRDSGKWNSIKRRLAARLGDITSVWMCGPRNRDIAFQNGFTSWKNDHVTSEHLGHKKGGKRGAIIDKMLTINRQNIVKVQPSRLSEEIFAWKKQENEVFVDFETFTDVFSDFSEIPYQNPRSMIYHIGVGWFGSDGNWIYKYFISNEPTQDEEYRIMKEFTDLLEERNDPDIYYWHAEKNFWKSACEKQYERSDLSAEKKDAIIYWGIDAQLKDLRKLFVNEQIVIKNCFGYGLKEIAKCLKQHDLISTPLESECANGRTAMIQAWRAYSRFEQPVKSGVMKDVTQYNEFDCRVLGDILTYLRRNHQ